MERWRSFARPEFFFHEGGHGAASKRPRGALRSFALDTAGDAATTTQLATSVTDSVIAPLLAFILL